MRAEEFVVAVRALMPTVDELRARGLGEDEISEIQDIFRLPERSGALDDPDADELVRLVRLFNCSRLQISRVEFLPVERYLPWGVQVAQEEAEPILIASNGEVTLVDRAQVGTVLQRCASDGAGFLSALELVAVATRAKSAWKGRLDELTRECAVRAGGHQFGSYFRSLCAFAAS